MYGCTGRLRSGGRGVQKWTPAYPGRPKRFKRVWSCVRVIPRVAAAWVLLPLVYARAAWMARCSRAARASGAVGEGAAGGTGGGGSPSRPKWAAVRRPPSARMRARSMAFASSRMLPGQG